jgi:hypothetical protein
MINEKLKMIQTITMEIKKKREQLIDEISYYYPIFPRVSLSCPVGWGVSNSCIKSKSVSCPEVVIGLA